MQKYRLAILIPEVVEAIRKSALGYLDKEVKEPRNEWHDERFIAIVFTAVKSQWQVNKGEGEEYIHIPNFDYSALPKHPRYTESLVQTNAMLQLPCGFETPVIDWNGVALPVDIINEVWKCTKIDDASDGDDYIESQREVLANTSLGYTIAESTLPTIEEQVELGFIMQSASNLSLVHGGKLKQSLPN